MNLPIDPLNVASVLAVAGLMNLAGVETRVRDGLVESSLDVDVDVLCAAAQLRFRKMVDWPTDVNQHWWRSQVWLSIRNSDREMLDTLAALAGECGPRSDDWAPSQWRLVSGQQRWLGMIRSAAQSSTREAILGWLSESRWPRTNQMAMSGVDGPAFRPASLRYDTRPEVASQGHPVSLWLMFEGIRLLPVVPAKDGPRTLGWKSPSAVRFPIWDSWLGTRRLVSIWRSSWLMADDLDNKVIQIGELGSQHSSARSALLSSGLSGVLGSRKYYDPAPYYARLSLGQYL